MYHPDIYSTYATLNQPNSNTATPPGYNYPQYGQYGTDQYTTPAPSPGLNQYGGVQYGACTSYPQYNTPANSATYSAAGSSGWDPNTSNWDPNSAGYSYPSYQGGGYGGGNYGGSGGSGNYSGSGNCQSQNKYSSGSGYSSSARGAGSGEMRGAKLTKVTPFKTDHLYNCPNTGQPIQCTTCDVIMPSYSIASVHFNSPKHHRKRMNELHYPSEKRKKLLEISETDPTTLKMECTICSVKPGSYDGFLSHMASFKHIKKLNNIGPETRTFNIACEPCDERILTIEHLSMHVNMKSHMRDVAKKLKELYPDLKDDSSQWHCAACNKSCNSMQTFDAHCASVKHRNKVKQFENQKFEEEFEQVENSDQFDKLEQPAEVGEAASSSSWQAPPPPPTQRPPKPLKVDKETPVPDLYQCKVCNFGTSEKYLMDQHYETDSHRANKLLKRRHDELYRVADVAKRDHKGVYLGDIVPINATGAVRCDICELSFAHALLIDIHKRGKLHREMAAKLEDAHEKLQSQHKTEATAAVGVLASTVKPEPPKPVPKGGHHCDACNVHTSCLTRYLAHVSSKDHRKMMAQLAKSGVPGSSAPADSSEKFELRPGALAPPTLKRPPPSNWHQPGPKHQARDPNKKRKKKTATSGLRIQDYLNGLPVTGIPPEAVREDGRFECKPCAVVVQQEHSFKQHCQGKKHINKTNIAAESSAGATGPNNNTEIYNCNMCNVSCPTGAETLAHLSSKEHARGPTPSSAKEEKEGGEGSSTLDEKKQKERDLVEIIRKFFCDVCSLDCRTESSFNLHLKGIKHTKKLTALTDEAESVMNKVDCGSSSVRKNLSCAKCEVHCKSIVNYEQHLQSDGHKAKMARVRFPITTNSSRPYNSGWNRSLPSNWNRRY